MTNIENRESFLARIAHLPKTDIERIDYAYDIAKESFRTKFRDGGDRYFEHLRAVAILIMDVCEIFDADIIIGALLHDTLEDTGIFGNRTVGGDRYLFQARFRIEGTFGKRVADMVLGMTKPFVGPGGYATKAEMLAVYYGQLRYAPEEVRLLKLADRAHNTSTLDSCAPEKIRRQIKETGRSIIPLATITDGTYAAEMSLLVQEIKQNLEAAEYFLDSTLD